MSVYISPNLTKKKSDYKPSDKITIYLNYYFQGKKLRIPSEVSVLFKDWDKNWKQGRKLFSTELNQKENENYNNEGSLENQLLELKSLFEKGLIPDDIYLKKVSELI